MRRIGHQRLFVETSSLAYPAPALPEIALGAGARLIQVNPGRTPLDGVAHHNLPGTCGEIMPSLVNGAWPG
jgi:NAD-dependent deacetylase